jgi:hypothetical protein
MRPASPFDLRCRQARNTIAGWEVKDIESVMAGLRERGVVFEEYDLG